MHDKQARLGSQEPTADILARLKAATAGSRELDARIHCELVEDRAFRVDVMGRFLGKSRKPPHDECIVLSSRSASTGDFLVLRYTASLHAALALVEAKLPGWTWLLSNQAMTDGMVADGCGAYLRPPISSGWTYDGVAPTAPLALLIALFTSLEPLSDGHSEAKANALGVNGTTHSTLPNQWMERL